MDTIKITIETNAQDTAQTFEQLSNAFNDSTKSSEDLRKQIKGLKDDLYKLEPGTKEYADTLEQLGSKMNQLSDTQQELRVATGGLDTVFQTTTQATASLAAGFTAAAGVISLFGGDTEDLQKTFVKLQAAMAIMNGLKGFAGFTKMAGRALISIRSYVAQISNTVKATTAETVALTKNTTAVNANTTAKTANAAAGNAMAESQAKNTLAVGSSSSAIGGLTSKLGTLKSTLLSISSTTVVVAGVFATWVGFMTYLWKEAKTVREQLEATNEVEKSLWKTTETLEEKQAKANTQFDKTIEAYKSMGLKQETLNKLIKNHYTVLRDQAKAQYDSEIALSRFYATSAAMNKEWKEHNELAAKAVEELKKYEAILSELDSKPVPEWMTKLNEQQRQFTRSIQRAVNQGVITEGQGIERELNKAKADLAELNQMVEDYYSGDWERIAAANKKAFTYGFTLNDENIEAQIALYEQNVQYYTEQLEDYNDKQIAAASKKFRDLQSSLAKEHETNYKKLMEDFAKDSKDIEKKLGDFDEQMITILSSFNFSDEEFQGKLHNSFALVQNEIDEFANKARNSAKELLAQNKISIDEYNKFVSEVYDKAMSLSKFGTYYSKNMDLTDRAVVINHHLLENVGELKVRLESLNTLYKEGIIDQKQYNDAYLDNIDSFNSRLSDEKGEIEDLFSSMLSPEYLDEEIDMVTGETFGKFLERQQITAEQYVEFLRNLFKQSGTILPPETANEIRENVAKIIDSQIKDAENIFNAKKQELMTKYQAESNSIFNTFWGAGEGQQYKAVKQNLQDTWKEYEDMYKEESDALKKGMDNATSLEEYQAYQEAKKQLDADYEQAHEEYLASLEDAEHTHLKNMFSNINATASAVASLGSALSDYYDEMANDERLSTEEQQKYALKSLQMKKFQAVANIASGIVAAISTAMEMGFPMGPIIGAIEAASVAVAGAAQIKSINKQIRELGGSSGSDSIDANVSGITDRVVFGEAQAADQQAQLNADYSQGATRVFVTTEDINAKQGETKTAVTNNVF